ncbi:hypothetical protein BJY00DRAFT_319864 [Aspergillus carlsbadensis]|nr:hypothetical protein BJY00DRAFT_319864 [Aspergillus carlsbadensis]
MNSSSDSQKIHLDHLEGLNDDSIIAYATTHFPLEEPIIEWTDDSSANLCYSSREVGQHALEAFTHDAKTMVDRDHLTAEIPDLRPREGVQRQSVEEPTPRILILR